jgi:hypothetical protein
MRKLTLFFLTFLCTCGLALSLSAQCAINVIIVDVTCSDAGGPSIFVNFLVDGTDGSQWTSPTLNVSGVYNTGTLYSAGPFPGEFIENVLFQDVTNGACFTVIDRIEGDCGPNCAIFDANAERNEVEFCESGETWTLNPRNPIWPVEVQIFGIFGDTTFVTLSPDVPVYTSFFDEGEYLVTMTDANGCFAETEFFAEAHACSSIVGRSWLDANNNGLQDENEDTPVSGVVSLISANDQNSQSAETDDNGIFRFTGLLAGEYLMVIEGGEGLSLTVQSNGNSQEIDSDFQRTNSSTFLFGLEPGQTRTDLDAGWGSVACDSLSVNAFGTEFACNVAQVLAVDVTSNSYPVTIQLTEINSGTSLDSVEVDGPGLFIFGDIIPGTISVIVSNAEGCMASTFYAVNDAVFLDVRISQEGNTCFGGVGVTLTADAFGSDGVEYIYEWSTGENTQSIFNVVNGEDYQVLVTDPVNGCQGEAEVFVQGFGEDSLSFFQAEFVIPCDANSVLVTPDTIIEGFTYRWFGNQNEVIDGPSFYATRTGFYQMEAFNSNNCLISGFVTVSSNNLDDQFIELFEWNQDSTCGDQACFGLETSLNPNSELDFTIVWEGPNEEFNESANEDPFRFICSPFPGLYQVTITTVCDTLVLSLFVEDFLGCSSISGNLWIDQAADCDLDAEDTPVPNYVIMLTDASGAVYYALTDAQGNWSAELPLGTYVIEPTLNPGAPFGTCSPPVSVTLGNSPVAGVNVFLPVTEQCPQLTTDVSIPFLRRCFSSNAWVAYENVGAVTANNAELVVTLDDFFTNVTANASFTRDGNTYTFQLGDLPPFASGQVFFSFIVSCDANFGQSHCIESDIKPDEPCGETENWDGALLTVDALGCDGDSVTFLVTNIGEQQMSIPLSYIIVEDGIMLSPTPFINGLLESNETMQIAVPTTGGTYHLITNQEPFAPADSMPTAVIEGCQIVGGNTFSTGFTNILPLTNGQRTTSVVCRENVGSYDPNDKNGYPLGFEGDNIFSGTRLDYAIRFQNTGTDTAFTVVIRDTIAESLDLSTLKFESASHDYTVILDTHRVLTFVFENILLPDSSRNLAGSQGVVNFSIDHDPSLVVGDIILNDAAIYFDFNEPIITNVSRHVISKDGLPVSTRAVRAQQVALSVFPNPTDGLLNVYIPATDVAYDDVLTVTDLYGRELARTNYASAANGWNLKHLPAGYYVLVLLDDAGRARGRAGLVRQ